MDVPCVGFTIFYRLPTNICRPQPRTGQVQESIVQAAQRTQMFGGDMRLRRPIADECLLPADLVRSITLQVDRNEYKRKQAPPGLKVTSKAFSETFETSIASSTESFKANL